MSKITKEREVIFERLRKMVGNTSLYEIKNIPIPNGCRIFCKEENKNPTNSHYDRFWVDFLYDFEISNDVDINAPLLETSTGNNGASFAWVCRCLGYKDYGVIIPKDMPYARTEQIKDLGAEIYLSPADEYVTGAIEMIPRCYANLRRRNKNVRFLNHAVDGERAIKSIENIGIEIIHQLKSIEVNKVDYYISALGNGLTTKGIGKILKSKYNSKIIGVEPIECPTVTSQINKEFNKPESFGKTHGLIGCAPGTKNYSIFPIMTSFLNEIDSVELINESDWKKTLIQLSDIEGKFVGHTSAACVNIALKQAENAPPNSTILTVFYDSSWKYL